MITVKLKVPKRVKPRVAGRIKLAGMSGFGVRVRARVSFQSKSLS